MMQALKMVWAPFLSMMEQLHQQTKVDQELNQFTRVKMKNSTIMENVWKFKRFLISMIF